MPIIEPAIRPPAEADSFLLQVTTGCSTNHCTFCGAYQGKPFRMKSEAEIVSDIKEVAQLNPDIRRVFLMDGDALAISNEKLIPIIRKIESSFPKLTRISSYANAYQINNRSKTELEELTQHRLKLIYIGLESGNQKVLDYCRKSSSAIQTVEAVRKAAESGIKSSVMVLLGLGGKKYSADHVKDTINALNQMQPRYLSFLSVMLIPGTRLYYDAQTGNFQELNPMELLVEAYDVINGLELEMTVFRCDHASNYLPLEGRFPTDKTKLLTAIELALKGLTPLKPEYSRGL